MFWEEKLFVYGDEQETELNYLIIFRSDVKSSVEGHWFMHIDELRIEFLQKLNEMFHRIQMTVSTGFHEEVMIECQRLREDLIEKDGFIRQQFVFCRRIDVDLSERIDARSLNVSFQYFVLRISIGFHFGIVTGIADAEHWPNVCCSSTKQDHCLIPLFLTYLFERSDGDSHLHLYRHGLKVDRSIRSETLLLLHKDLSTMIWRVCLWIKMNDRSAVTISCFRSNIR